jgi:hypothetical protein
MTPIQKLIFFTNTLVTHTFGGLGVFCLIYSFILPKYGERAFLYISAAIVLSYLGRRSD